VLPELCARYPHRTEAELRALIADFVRADLLASYNPQL
jgi:hypothetical protein